MTPNPLMQLLPILMIFLVMYFLLIRPQVKQQKELSRLQSELKKNDEVVTMGGIHGIVVNVKDGVVTLRVDDNVRVDVDKSAISRRVKEGAE